MIKTVKCQRPKFYDNSCIFRNVTVDGKKRRYYMDSVMSVDRYYVEKGQWYKETEIC